MSAQAAGSPAHVAPERQTARLRELAAVFLRLGLIAFGGPAAHIAMMEDEAVVRRKWLTREQFLDLLGVTNLLPGPSSSELAIYLGYVRAGWPGLLVGGTCFIVPAAALVTAIAWTYARFGSLPEMAGMLYGIRPVMVAIIVLALWRLGQAAIKDATSAVVAIAAVALSVAGLSPLAVLVITGLAVAAVRTARGAGDRGIVATLPAALAIAPSAGSAAVGLGSLFLVFLKLGAVVFGSGYVLLAFLRADLVENDTFTRPECRGSVDGSRRRPYLFRPVHRTPG